MSNALEGQAGRKDPRLVGQRFAVVSLLAVVVASILPLALGLGEVLLLWPLTVVDVPLFDSAIEPVASVIGVLAGWGVLAVVVAIVASTQVVRGGTRRGLRSWGWVMITAGVVAAWSLVAGGVVGHLVYLEYPDAPVALTPLRGGLVAAGLLVPAGVAVLAIRTTLLRTDSSAPESFQ